MKRVLIFLALCLYSLMSSFQLFAQEDIDSLLASKLFKQRFFEAEDIYKEYKDKVYF